jgi:hypothetical protein
MEVACRRRFEMKLYWVPNGATRYHGTLYEAKQAALEALERSGGAPVHVHRLDINSDLQTIVDLANGLAVADGDVVWTAGDKGSCP